MVARLSAQIDAIGREIGQMRREIASQLARIEEDVADAKVQARTTDERVTAHDRELDRITTREQVRADMLREQQEDRDRRAAADRERQNRRMRLLQWIVGVTLAVLVPAVGWLIAIVG